MAARKSLSPLIILFVLLNMLFIVFRSFLEKKGFNVDVLLIGNLVLWLITLFSAVMLQKGLRATSTAGFLRSVYGSFMIKLFLVAALVFGYLMLNKENFNKPAIFSCMFLYLVYTFIEIRGLLKLSKQNPDA
ncbi:hypothetical protein [Pollutibacter soli]|uniref:hypothetical protein n=1 Tax=Pollutibacter soli TaxID=3034157 RepID=UPI003013CB96